MPGMLETVLDVGLNAQTVEGMMRLPGIDACRDFIDFQFNGQGEDVVDGRRTSRDEQRLRSKLPQEWSQLEAIGRAGFRIYAAGPGAAHDTDGKRCDDPGRRPCKQVRLRYRLGGPRW